MSPALCSAFREMQNFKAQSLISRNWMAKMGDASRGERGRCEQYEQRQRGCRVRQEHAILVVMGAGVYRAEAIIEAGEAGRTRR